MTCSTLLRASSASASSSSASSSSWQAGKKDCCVNAYNPKGFVTIVVVGTGANPACCGSSCLKNNAAASSHCAFAHNAARAYSQWTCCTSKLQSCSKRWKTWWMTSTTSDVDAAATS